MLLVGCASNANKESTNGVLSNNDATAEENELVLYTSIYPIQYVVEQIAGDAALVESVYPPGVDAHTYEPTSKVITDLANGDAFFYLGAGLEGFVDSAREALASQKVVFVDIEENNGDLFLEGEHEHAHDEDGHDEHGYEDEKHDHHAHEEEDEHDDHGHGDVVSTYLA